MSKSEDKEDVENNHKKFKKLEERRTLLEAKLREKLFELRELCISEGELTGTLPMEIPLEPGESPPKVKRRIRTMFPYTEEIVQQLEVGSLPGLLGKSPKRKSPRRKPTTALSTWNSNNKGSQESLTSPSHPPLSQGLLLKTPSSTSPSGSLLSPGLRSLGLSSPSTSSNSRSPATQSVSSQRSHHSYKIKLSVLKKW